MYPRIHHVGVSAPPAAYDLLSDLAATGATRIGDKWDVGDHVIEVLRMPNLYVAWEPAEDRVSFAGRRRRDINAPGLAHLCLQGRDGALLRRTMEQAGTNFFSPPIRLGTGYEYAYARAADGRLLELESAPGMPPRPPAWVAHLAYVSQRADELAAFYASLLGVKLISGGRFSQNANMDRMAGLEGIDVEIWWVKSAPIGLEFFRYHAPASGDRGLGNASYAHLGLEVAEIAAAITIIRELGGCQEGGIMQGKDGSAAWARDPDGNRIQLLQLHGDHHRVSSLPYPTILAEADAVRAA
ncbi:VOC family protein [Sphingomonas sp. BN140010]|uniref:VOC family protein n=1 Tax=Sphingomonas arvum TaxID=2992113 RepID=A0ABT3JCU3_9SPHN|nr:VOC family protein [Sphingomonas sp. BN140010]MCW3796898.1 VOC family protein [Sphingomonas sp. BN140010]